MYYTSSSRVDVEAFIALPDGRKIRAHQTGYIEGDTNGFVEGDYNLYWDDDDGEELTDAEAESWCPDYEPQETREVHLMGEEGSRALRAYAFGGAFEYADYSWQVRHPKPVTPPVSGGYTIGEANNYKAIYTLIRPFESMTIGQYVDKYATWQRCDCNDY